MAAKHPAKDPTVSLCMIVKNEEAMLPRCLDSVRGCVDEIVVVDTGSKDRTVELARQYSARIFHQPWEDDFGKHRNQSVEHATGDWILQMDADEELAEHSRRPLREAIEDREADAFLVTVQSYYNQRASCTREQKIRIFRRGANVRYEGTIHEQVRGCSNPKVKPIVIYHYGYDLEPAKQREKVERNAALLQRQIASEPDSYWHHHNLAVNYASNFRSQEAIAAGTRALALAEKQGLGGHNVLWTHYIVALSYFKLGQLDRAEDFALQALRRSPDHLDCRFVLILIYHQQKRWQDLERQAMEFFRIVERLAATPEGFSGSIIHSYSEGWRVRLALADHYLDRNEMDKVQVAFQTAISETPVPWECLKIMADCYKNRASWEEAAQYYEQAVNEKDDFSEAVLGLALARHRLGQSDAAIRHYKRALTLKPDSIEAMVHLGDLYRERGAVDQAREYYESALAHEANLIHASLRLANLTAKQGEFEACVGHCETILKGLGLPCNQTLRSLADLADLFLLIAHHLDRAQKEDLCREALEVATLIQPNLINSLEPSA